MALPRTGQGSAHRLLFFPAVARIRSRGREHQAHFLLPVRRCEARSTALVRVVHFVCGPMRPITLCQMAQFCSNRCHIPCTVIWYTVSSRQKNTDSPSGAISPIGQIFAGGYENGVIKLWTLPTAQLLYTFVG